MSINTFNINTSTNPFQTGQNPFKEQANKSQQNQQSIPNSSTNNVNQEQKTQENKSSFFSGTNNNNNNIFNNAFSTNSQATNNKKDDNNPFNSFSFLNSNQTKKNDNIFTNPGNVNKEENKTNSIINTNIATNTNINTNNNLFQNTNTNNNIINTDNTNINKDTSTDFFNIKNKNGVIGDTGKKEEKKEEENNIFLAKSNSFLNNLNNDSNIKKDNKDNNKGNLNFENNNNGNVIEPKSLLNELSINNNGIQNQNQNNGNKQDKKADEFINNLLAEDKLVSSNKEMKEYIKIQTLNKFGEEVINEIKTTLDEHKKAFHECVKSTREYEERFYELGKIGKEEADFALKNQIRYEKLLKDINNLYQNTNGIEEKVSLKNKNLAKILDHIDKINKENNNNINYINRINFEDKNKFYKDLLENSKRLKKLEDELNIINSNFQRNEQDMFERDEFYEKYSNNDKGLVSFNNDMEGVWIERNNTKIYVEQKEMDEIYNDCYNGLCGLIDEDKNIMNKIDKLNRKIIEAINKNNGIVYYDGTLNKNNNNINNYNIGFGNHT